MRKPQIIRRLIAVAGGGAIAAAVALAVPGAATAAPAVPRAAAAHATASCPDGSTYYDIQDYNGQEVLDAINQYNQGPVTVTTNFAKATNFCYMYVGEFYAHYGVLQQPGTQWCLSADDGTPNGDIVTVQSCNGEGWQDWAVCQYLFNGKPYTGQVFTNYYKDEVLTLGSIGGEQFLAHYGYDPVDSQVWNSGFGTTC